MELGLAITCPKCHFENLPDTRFCGNCAAPLPSPQEKPCSDVPKPLTIFAKGSLVAGKYRIDELIGRGGMGIIYKAEDTKLQRPVALKFLPEDLACNHQALERFQREARAASALNHAHICTIYDIDEHEGQHFMALEFLEGHTLREYLQSKRLAIDQIIDLGIQISSGLEVAHAKGIIHRDIKPGNIFVTDSGQAKILDFGLAKLLPERKPKAEEKVSAGMPTMTAEEHLTSPGSTVGTVAYMSPEQARGEGLDARTDLFSFGVVLYEMATGQQAFRGPTSAVIFDAILHKAPPAAIRLNPDVPGDLERIINKALEKERKLRYQSAGDMRADLERLKRDSTSSRIAAIDEQKSSALASMSDKMERRRWGWWAVGAIAVVALAMVAVIVFSGRKHSIEAFVPHVANAVKVTTDIGYQGNPSWSPDGRTLAYQSYQAGNWDIWVTQLGSVQGVNRTRDSTANDSRPTWSPDGQWIAFFSSREGGGYFVMPGIGGIARKVASCPTDDWYANTAAWSPDSAQLAYALGQGTKPWIEIMTLASGVSNKLEIPERPLNNCVVDISWSPNGRWLAYVRSLSSNAATSELWLTGISDGRSIQLTDGSKMDRSPTWSPDSRGLYFVSDRGGTTDLWRFTIGRDGKPRGAPQQVTAGIEMSHAVLSPNGQKLAYTKGRRVRNAYCAPILKNRPADWADTVQLTFDEAEIESIDVSLDGRIIVSSDRAGNWDVYTLSASGDLQQLIADPALDAGPRWKPDGKEVAFYSSRTGHREVWIMPLGGGPARQLTRGESARFYPAWSPNGQEIVSVGENGLYILPAEGGEMRRLTDKAGDGLPDWSPDGRWVVFDSNRDGAYRLWRVPASGGPPERLTKGAALTPRWSPDGNQIYFIGDGDRANNVWSLSLANREERPVTALTGRRGTLGSLGLATNGKSIYFIWGETRGNIWVTDIIQQPRR